MKRKELTLYLQKVFQKHNLSKKHSLICSQYLVKSELIGAKSHGLARLKMYCDRIKKGVINSKPKIKIKKLTPSIFHINADNAIGFVAADTGIQCAIKSAKKMV